MDELLDRIGAQPFRARFRLRGRDRALAQLSGPARLRAQALEIVSKRLAPALPYKDGKQTPYRGHPVFVAQHATATCCRSCLERNHGIERGRELNAAEREHVVGAICRWLERELDATQPASAAVSPATTPSSPS